MAVRTALGAGRGALVRQVLMESVVLSVVGGAVGLLLAGVSLGVLLRVFGGSLPGFSVAHIRLDMGVMIFALALSLATGLLFGLVPAFRASRFELSEEIKAGSRGVSGARDRLRSLLVVSELALALVLLVGAALMIRSLQQLQMVDKGFDPTQVLTARTRLPRSISSDTAVWHRFYSDALDRLKVMPGVKSTAASLLLPLSDRSWERGIWPEGVPPTPGTGQSVLYNIVSPDYFATLGVPIIKGRGFTDADRSGSSLVAIIDETMAERFWPGQDPVNKRVTLERTMGDHSGDPIYRTVIGVAKNVRHYELATPSRIQVYIPLAQIGMGFGPTLAFLVKSATTATAQIPPVGQALASLSPDVPVTDLLPMQDYVDAGLAGNRALVQLLGTFGAIALMLASIGIFGVMSYTVAQRTREIGVRIALGATRAQVLGWVTGRALVLCGLGVAAGSVIAAGLSRVLTRLLYNVSPLDMRIYVGVAFVLLVAALAAAILPARRAAGVDPIEALRGE
jgi:predicted permease